MSTPRRALLVLAALVLLGVALVLAWRDEPAEVIARHRITRSFALATGGFGLGASISSEWSSRNLDPRLERASGCDLFPLPGGPGFCPDQTTGLFSPPDETEGLPTIRRATGIELGTMMAVDSPHE